MLTTPVSVPDLRPGSAAEPKWDGFRALASVDEGQVVLRSMRGTEMGPSFPNVAAAAVQLPDTTALDGEAVVYLADGEAGARISFEAAQSRALSNPSRARELAARRPATYVT